MKILNGKELAEYIEEKQAKQVRQLRQAHNVQPKLAIVVTVDNPVIDVYMKLKQKYGEDILIDVDVHRVQQSEAKDLLNKLSKDDSVHGIIVQLPLEDPTETDEIVNLVAPTKDVDGLGKKPDYEPATPLAIMWLLSAYNIELKGKNILLVGQGKLVGSPLKKLLEDSGITPEIANRKTEDLKAKTLEADILITATGIPGLIKADMIKQNAVVIDAGVASEGAKTAGDVDPTVLEERIDLTITPIKGGVGPLTVCALFENVIRSAMATVKKEEKS
jgi:methylenetetrahydrofolate dehydrogenase (NADP+)/methenyltetrahydrofolate cyclohydrolase